MQQCYNSQLSCLNFDSSVYVNKTIDILSAHTVSPCSPLSATQPHTQRIEPRPHTATHGSSIAAIQMCIAEDVWWFSNLRTCHWEMGRADPRHPHGASQTAPHLHLNLPLLTTSPPLHCVVHLLSKCQDKCSTAASPHIPRVGMTCSSAASYNVMLSLGKGSTLTCYVDCAEG